MKTLHFSSTPNAHNVIGEPVIESSCGYFRIQEIAASGWYTHWRPTLRRAWQGIPPQPFASRESAIAACEKVASREKLPRKRGQRLNDLMHEGVQRKKGLRA